MKTINKSDIVLLLEEVDAAPIRTMEKLISIIVDDINLSTNSYGWKMLLVNIFLSHCETVVDLSTVVNTAIHYLEECPNVESPYDSIVTYTNQRIYDVVCYIIDSAASTAPVRYFNNKGKYTKERIIEAFEVLSEEDLTE